MLAVALLIALALVALALWQWLPRPHSRWAMWIPIVAALLASRFAGADTPVLSVRSIAWSGGAFVIVQAAIQLLLAGGLIAL